MRLKGWLLLLVLLVAGSADAKDVQHILWDKTPIYITLPLNKERLIRFPFAISIVDSELDEDVGVLKIEDALYLNPHKAFDNKRMVVQLMPQGEAIVLNLSATKDALDTTSIEVLMGEEEGAANDKEPNQVESTDVVNSDINAVSLTRFAIQSLYAPARLLVTPTGVRRTPMLAHRTDAMVYGASVTARPLISWYGGQLYVTAIELKNELNKSVIISPQQLIGDWQTAAFYPTNTLSARGKNDTTTLFVTSQVPFGEALAASREFVR